MAEYVAPNQDALEEPTVAALPGSFAADIFRGAVEQGEAGRQPDRGADLFVSPSPDTASPDASKLPPRGSITRPTQVADEDATTGPPTRLRIPAIDVDAPVAPVGLTADRALEVPSGIDIVGWWRGGSLPGARGPAVLVGHIDTKTAPAVFVRLSQVAVGDAIEVIDSSGSSVQYVVRRVEQHPKDRFPTTDVYGATALPTLRLLSCGGSFDRRTGHYRDNVVVFADLVSPA